MTSQESRPVVPESVERKLVVIRRAELAQRAGAGLLWTAAALVAVMLAAMALDRAVMFFDPAWRSGVTFTSLALAAVVLVWALVTMARSWRRLSSVARDVDQAVPSLQERWSTVTELAESSDEAALRGSPALINRVSAEAGEMSGLVKAGGVVRTKRLKIAGGAAALAVVALSLFLLIGGETATILLSRFWSPGAPITLTRVTSLTGDRVVPRGEPLVIEAQLGGLKRSTATILFRGPGHAATAVEMNQADQGPANFTWATKAAADSFEYRIRSGDGQTPWHRIEVAERPALAAVRWRLTPPPYGNLPAEKSENLPAQARAMEGSRLELELLPTKPLRKMELSAGKAESLLPVRGEGQWYRLDRPLNESLSFAINLTDERGLANAKPPTCQITVYQVPPPEVKIITPEGDVVVRPDEQLTVEAEARGELGITKAELEVYSAQGENKPPVKVLAMTLDKPGAKQTGAKALLDLKSLDLKQGEELTYVVRATDARGTVTSTTGKVGTPNSSQTNSQTAAADAQSNQAAAKNSSESGSASSAQSPALASQNSNQNNPPSSAASEASKSKPPEGAPKPPDDMERRNFPGAACSGSQRIKIDEWADTHESQKRQKLQLAIDQFLSRLDAALAAAEKPSYDLAEHVRATSPWKEAETTKLAGAIEHLGDGRKVIDELVHVSAGTPYSFMGLQLQDIGESHVTPAVKALAEAGRLADGPPEQLKQLEQGAYHITRARALLADLTKKYEGVRREKDLADRLTEVKKMHQMFVEDMQALIGASKPTLNPRTGKMTELSDEEIEALQKKLADRFEQLKDLQARLAEALAKDPELLRRFMAAMRMEGTTIRDQLTILAMRQEQLEGEVYDWTQADAAGRPAVKNRLATAQQKEQTELAAAMGVLDENLTTWWPRGLDATGPIKECRNLSAQIAKQTARLTTESNRRQSAAQAAELSEQLSALDQKLADALSADAQNENVAIFVANRMTETETLASRQDAWSKKVVALDADQYAPCGELDQARLALDTVEFAQKLDGYQAAFSRMSAEIAKKAAELQQTIATEIVDHQKDAHAALDGNDLTSARVAESRAVKSFQKAEKEFDELLTMIENASPPAGGGSPPPLPTLEQILAMLENEMKACEKLGLACNKINLMINADWLKPGSGSGSGGRGAGMAAGINGARQLLRQSLNQMEKARQEAQRAAALMSVPPPAPPGTPDNITRRQPGDDKDWATLVSKLKKDLSQVRDNVPPEQYQHLINEYFKALDEAIDRSGPTP